MTDGHCMFCGEPASKVGIIRQVYYIWRVCGHCELQMRRLVRLEDKRIKQESHDT